MKIVSLVALIVVPFLFIIGCGKEEKSDRDKIRDAIEGEYAGYFSFQDAFSADDDETLMKTQFLVTDSVCWRYRNRSVSRTIDISVSNDTAIVTVQANLMANAYFRIWNDGDTMGTGSIHYVRPVTFEGSRRARFVRADDRWRLNAIAPIGLSTNPATARIDSLVAINITSGDTFRIIDPTLFIPIDSLFTVAPSDSIDVMVYSPGTYVIFRYPRGARYELAHSDEEAHGYRYGIRTDAHPGPRHFIVDAITRTSATDSTLSHDGRIWGLVFIVRQ